jgi:hypothetical protein
MDLERNKAILQDNFSNESDVKLQMDDFSIKESEVSTFICLLLVDDSEGYEANEVTLAQIEKSKFGTRGSLSQMSHPNI